MFIKTAITEIDRPDCPSKQITQKVFQNLLKRQGWTFIKEKKKQQSIAQIAKTQEKYNFTIFYIFQITPYGIEHSATIAQLKTQSNLYKVNSSRHYKCKGSFTEEFQSILELQNHQIPKVKTGLANHCNNNWRHLSDSGKSATSFSTQ